MILNSFSTGTVFRRQNMTSEVAPRTERVLCIMALENHAYNICIQMKRKELRHLC